MSPIQLFDISRFRAQHMGFAMIIIMLFHISLPRHDAFYGLCRMGNLGVDIFLFLSGMGLWFSVTKTAASTPFNGTMAFVRSWLLFYWRRLKRVYPAWLIIACLYYIPKDILHATPTQIILGTADNLTVHTDRLWEATTSILINYGFWQHDEGTFWYVPATMMLYIFAFPFIHLIRRYPTYRWLVALPMIWCVIMQYVTPVHAAVGHIEIFWSRVPIFFIGICLGEKVRQRATIEPQALWMLLLLFALSFGTCVWLEQMKHGRFPLFLERMLYIPFAITLMLLLNQLFLRMPQWVSRSLTFVGGISLEIYLIHIEFVMRPLQHYHLGYWPTFALTLILTLPLAWLLQRSINAVNRN